MKSLIIALALSMSIVACGSQPSKSVSQPAIVQPVQYTYKVKNTYPHCTHCYTQGLQYVDGLMWEGTGEYGRSQLLRTDLASGKVLQSKKLSKEEFGEGITVLGDKIYQLTWLNGKLHIYDKATLRHLATHTYKGEGWGLTTDGEKLYMSNGTSDIYRINPENAFINPKGQKGAIDYGNMYGALCFNVILHAFVPLFTVFGKNAVRRIFQRCNHFTR